jgi:hypothetical protein
MEEVFDILNEKINKLLKNKYENNNNLILSELDVFVDNFKSPTKSFDYAHQNYIFSHLEKFLSEITDTNIKIYIGNINMYKILMLNGNIQANLQWNERYVNSIDIYTNTNLIINISSYACINQQPISIHIYSNDDYNINERLMFDYCQQFVESKVGFPAINIQQYKKTFKNKVYEYINPKIYLDYLLKMDELTISSVILNNTQININKDLEKLNLDLTNKLEELTNTNEENEKKYIQKIKVLENKQLKSDELINQYKTELEKLDLLKNIYLNIIVIILIIGLAIVYNQNYIL